MALHKSHVNLCALRGIGQDAFVHSSMYDFALYMHRCAPSIYKSLQHTNTPVHSLHSQFPYSPGSLAQRRLAEEPRILELVLVLVLTEVVIDPLST